MSMEINFTLQDNKIPSPVGLLAEEETQRRQKPLNYHLRLGVTTLSHISVQMNVIPTIFTETPHEKTILHFFAHGS